MNSLTMKTQSTQFAERVRQTVPSLPTGRGNSQVFARITLFSWHGKKRTEHNALNSDIHAKEHPPTSYIFFHDTDSQSVTVIWLKSPWEKLLKQVLRVSSVVGCKQIRHCATRKRNFFSCAQQRKQQWWEMEHEYKCNEFGGKEQTPQK